MQSTQKQPAIWLADLSSSPAAVLRHTAVYLWRYGWTIEQFYDRTDQLDADPAFPPADVAGAIRCVVFGHPVDSVYDEIIDPDHTRHARVIVDAQAALADDIDPGWLCDLACGYRDGCALEVINDWNDEPGRTLTDVLIVLYSAADEWDRLHPATVSGVAA